MVFCLNESMEAFKKGLEILGEERGFTIGGTGIILDGIQVEENVLKVEFREHKVLITYRDTVHFYRGLMHILQYFKENPEGGRRQYSISEEVFFDTNGAMFDCSRNGVLRSKTIKEYIRRMALLGMNRLYLYMEDTYEIKENPWFGAFRGRYTQEELKDCDAYAAAFGIELVPCVQTLAHLHTFLRYPKYRDYQDTPDILMVGREEVYELIENMIRSLSESFQSKYIHLGMDEAHNLGLGNYMMENGIRDRYQIMKEHLRRVCGICNKYGKKPMIWSDMFFRLGAPDGEYYNVPEGYAFTEEQKPKEDLLLVYWDYYHDKKEHYKKFAGLHKQLTDPVIFAGGAWTYNGVAPNQAWMETTSQAALTALKEESIKDVFVTFWQDNGAETPLAAGIPALVLYAEHGFAAEVSREAINQRISFLWDLPGEAFWLLDGFDHTNGTAANNRNVDNPSKFLLYQDVLLGLFDAQIQGLSLGGHYKKLALELSAFIKEERGAFPLISFYTCLGQLLSLKAELGINLYNAYQNKEREKLKYYMDSVLPECIYLTDRISSFRERLWFAECKPNGFEALDIRFAGLKKRLQSAIVRLESYLSGKTERLPELEEARICYKEAVKEDRLLSLNLWEYIVTAGNIAGI